jgi:hypothetical protein
MNINRQGAEEVHFIGLETAPSNRNLFLSEIMQRYHVDDDGKHQWDYYIYQGKLFVDH